MPSRARTTALGSSERALSIGARRVIARAGASRHKENLLSPPDKARPLSLSPCPKRPSEVSGGFVAGDKRISNVFVCEAFYNCGLQEAAAVDAARVVGMPPRMGDGGEFDGPSWALYRYWLSQDPAFRYAPSGTHFRAAADEY